jgi:hypothetical protein
MVASLQAEIRPSHFVVKRKKMNAPEPKHTDKLAAAAFHLNENRFREKTY